MKTKLPRYLTAGFCALAFAFVSLTAVAQEGEKKPKGPSKADLKKYDTNNDGVLDDAETAKMKADKEAAKAAKRQAELDQYDENKDGKINKAEREKMKADREAAQAEKKAQRDAKKKN